MWEKSGKAEQVRDANITWRMHFTCCITKATNTHSEYLIFRILIFHGKVGYANVIYIYIYFTHFM
jgi:hypothetical protein